MANGVYWRLRQLAYGGSAYHQLQYYHLAGISYRRRLCGGETSAFRRRQRRRFRAWRIGVSGSSVAKALTRISGENHRISVAVGGCEGVGVSRTVFVAGGGVAADS